MKYGSVCSGIEAATVAWHPLGFEPQWFSEIEKFPSAVLAHHYPNVPNLGDMTKIHETETFKRNPIDLLVGGTPYQSFSVAGLRKGMDDPRGNLALVFLGLIDKSRPRWVVWENVPGVLSSKQGRDFGSFVGGLGELRYGWAYRVLDAQYFGVPQRRRRVFVVGHLGDWRPAAAVLFERESLSWNLTPSRKEGKRITGFAESSIGGYREDTSVGTLKASGGVLGGGSETFINQEPIVLEDQGGSVMNVSADGLVGTLRRETHGHEPILLTMRDGCEGGGKGPLLQVDRSGTLATGNNQVLFQPGGVEGEAKPITRTKMQVRRLSVIECARLQGFPDTYLDIPFRGKPATDGPKYKALGNSMAVPVMNWIGRRIKMAEEL